MEGAERDMEIILMVFLKKKKKKSYLDNLVILTQKWYVRVTFYLLPGFFLILDTKRDQEVHENFSCFSRKKIFVFMCECQYSTEGHMVF